MKYYRKCINSHLISFVISIIYSYVSPSYKVSAVISCPKTQLALNNEWMVTMETVIGPP
jgi:hypothetical protein